MTETLTVSFVSFRLFDGVVSLGTVAKQLAVIGSSFRYIKNSLSKANTENVYLNNEQVSDYEEELKKIRHTLDVLKNELSQVKTLSKKVGNSILHIVYCTSYVEFLPF